MAIALILAGIVIVLSTQYKLINKPDSLTECLGKVRSMGFSVGEGMERSQIMAMYESLARITGQQMMFKLAQGKFSEAKNIEIEFWKTIEDLEKAGLIKHTKTS